MHGGNQGLTVSQYPSSMLSMTNISLQVVLFLGDNNHVEDGPAEMNVCGQFCRSRSPYSLSLSISFFLLALKLVLMAPVAPGSGRATRRRRPSSPPSRPRGDPQEGIRVVNFAEGMSTSGRKLRTAKPRKR